MADKPPRLNHTLKIFYFLKLPSINKKISKQKEKNKTKEDTPSINKKTKISSKNTAIKICIQNK